MRQEWYLGREAHLHVHFCGSIVHVFSMRRLSRLTVALCAVCVCVSLRRYAASHEGGVMAHYNLGLLYQDKGDTVNATQAFNTALQHHPQHGRHSTTQGGTDTYRENDAHKRAEKGAAPLSHASVALCCAPICLLYI